MGLKWLALLIGPTRFEWYVVRRGSKSKHHKDTCLKEIGLCLQRVITTLHSTTNIIGRAYVFIHKINNKHALVITITESREVRFSVLFLRMFLHRFASNREFCCGNLISRSWRTQRTNQITPTYLK